MRSRSAIVACALLVAGGVSACGSGNGVAGKSAQGIVAAAAASLKSVNSLRIAGTITSGGTPITLDLKLVSGSGASGTMTEHGLSFKLIVIGTTMYINGSPGFWLHYGGQGAAALLKGKWLKGPLTGKNFGAFSALTDASNLLGNLLGSHDKLTKGASTTVNGQNVVGVHDASKRATLYVALSGPAYPVEIDASGADHGRLVFSKFNEAVSLIPPSPVIDISQLHG